MPALCVAILASLALARADVAAEEALRSAFPEAASFERTTAFLTERQTARVSELSGVDVGSKIVTFFTAHAESAVPEATKRPLGAAFVDTHLVRTKPETLLISVAPPGTIRRVEVLSFLEPPEYEVSERWLQQLAGRPLDDELRLRRAIRTLSGATLSSRSATDASRRALALYAVLIEASEGGE